MNNQKAGILGVIGLTLFLILVSVMTRKGTEKEAPEKPRRLVEVVEAKSCDTQRKITGYGTVKADRTLTLQAEVSGRMIHKSKNFDEGVIVEQGEFLARLDPRDYRNALEQATAAVEKARLDLEVEKGNQVVAKREWEEIGPSIKTLAISESLALRQPHLKEKEAALEGALAMMKKASTDLERTLILSPMRAIVIDANVTEGDMVSPQTILGKLVAVNQFVIQASVPVGALRYLNEHSEIHVIQDLGNGERVQFEGKYLRRLGDLEEGGRMARVLIVVKDPLGLEQARSLPLLLGSYVRIEFKGDPLKSVFVLPLRALREGDKVWVVGENQQLEIRNVRLLQRDEKTVTVDQGINEGDLVIVSALPLALPGILLEVSSDDQ